MANKRSKDGHPRPGIHIVPRKSPNHWALSDIIFWTIAALLKHILAFTGYTPPLKADLKSRQSFVLSPISVEGLLQLNDHDARSFVQATTQGKAAAIQDEDAMVNPFFLVAMTVPLVIRTLADRRCPVKPLGAVNTKNVFRFLDPTLCRSTRRLKTIADTGGLSYTTTFGGADRGGHRRKRGMEFCIAIILSADGIPILEQELWFLQFLPRHTEPRFEPLPGEQQDAPITAPTSDAIPSKLSIDSSDPQRWAASCKDYNPIHVSAIGAKLFGFTSVIAHGNHVAALVLQQLQSETSLDNAATSTARQICWLSAKPFSLQISFLRPLTLPSQPSVHWQSRGSTTQSAGFTVSSNGKLCVSGHCQSL